jgi:hypothetical protein
VGAGVHAGSGPVHQMFPLRGRVLAHWHVVVEDAAVGDTPARWQCLGTVLMELPADIVAQWAPGGSVIEYVTPRQARITLGAWSWAGIAGLLATFDADITVIEPDELKDACRTLALRYQKASK